MDTSFIQNEKQQYAKDMYKNGRINESQKLIMQDDYDPIFNPIEIHPESEITNNDINNIFKDITKDVNIINDSFIKTVSDFKELIQSSKSKLDNIETLLNTEKERMKDVNLLCDKYNDFTKVIQISNKNSTGEYDYEDSTFFIKPTSYKYITGEIVEINGNGYEGNDYVYIDDKFAKTQYNTSKREYILDNSNITYYEYSRITASNSEKNIFPLVNLDSINARCLITIKSKDEFNTIKLSLGTKDTILESLSTSNDGITFKQSSLQEIAITNQGEKYNDTDYIYGSGILSFDNCKYVKIILRSNSFSDDTIAFTKLNDNDENEIVKINTAKRSVIKINNIELSQKLYASSGSIKFDNFITNRIESIAIFANEYCCDDLSIRDCIKYTIKVNGSEYEIIPINSQYNGKKIVRTTSNTLPADYVHYINETIKNATLNIDITTNKKYASPFISDLKILIGSE